MRICTDSCVLIRAFDDSDPFAARLLDLISASLELRIPALVVREVTRNLQSNEQVRRPHHLFRDNSFAQIVCDPAPSELVSQYVQLGLRAKGDAYIGAFAEWIGAQFLISDNRHFLKELHAETFEVVDAQEFIRRWDVGLGAQA